MRQFLPAVAVLPLLASGSLYAQPKASIHAIAPIKLMKAQPVQEQEPEELKTAPPAPAPLGEAQLKHFLVTLQKESSSQTPPPSTPQSGAPSTGQRLVLTPVAPSVGQSCLCVYYGNSNPYLNCCTIQKQGNFLLRLATTPGKTYMLDLAVGGSNTWKFWGAVTGMMNLANGHVLVGFTATNAITYIYFKNNSGSYGYFYNAQMIPVN